MKLLRSLAANRKTEDGSSKWDVESGEDVRDLSV